MSYSPFDPDVPGRAAASGRFRCARWCPISSPCSRCARASPAIRLAIEGELEWALAAIVFAATLDGVDGRVARMLKGTSRFGAELDSLADFVNFGVAPGLILYFWGLHELETPAGSPPWCLRSAPGFGWRASTS